MATAKWTRASVEKLAAKAAKALDNGDCLKAGGLIDQGYYSLGRAEGSAARWSARKARKTLKAVDEVFEKVCVRRKPER